MNRSPNRFCCLRLAPILPPLLTLLWGGVILGQAAAPPAGTVLDDASTQAAVPGNSAQAAALAEAEAKIDARDYAGARLLLDRVLAGEPGSARALFDRGYVDDADGKPDAAAAFYEKALTADPNQFEAHLALGLDLAAAGKTDAARTEIEAATRLTPNPPNPAAQGQAYRALARLLRTSDPTAARDALVSALKLTPETAADTLLAAEIAEAAGDDDVAAEAYQRVLAAGADTAPAAISAQATAGLAHLLIRQKKYADAEPILRKALGTTPDDPALNAQLAAVLSAEGRQPEAVAILQKLHGTFPSDLHITAMLADIYSAGGDAEKADPLFAQLLAAAPDDPGLLASRGDNLVRQKRYADAVPVLERATRLDPTDADAWSALAFAASETHQPQLTLDALTMRSKVTIDTPATLFLRATAYDTLHQVKAAVETYKQFLATAAGKFPDQEWQAKHRLVALEK